MKKVIAAVVMIAVIVSHTPLVAQVEPQVPPVVTAAFANSFVQATNAAWRKCSDAVFLVTYNADDEYFLAYMSNRGTVLTTARKVSLEHSPMLFQQSIAGFQAFYIQQSGCCYFQCTGFGLTHIDILQLYAWQR